MGRCTVVMSATIVKRSWNQEKCTLPLHGPGTTNKKGLQNLFWIYMYIYFNCHGRKTLEIVRLKINIIYYWPVHLNDKNVSSREDTFLSWPHHAGEQSNSLTQIPWKKIIVTDYGCPRVCRFRKYEI
jgi:hypothetical protein